MKNLLFIIILLLSSCASDYHKEKRYCGIIIEKGYENPTSGYKHHHDATYFVILQVDSINTAIRVDCTVPTFYSLQAGDRGCFTLSAFDLGLYGNGSDHIIK